MMKLAKRAAALVLAAVLALSLTACSPKEVASNLILKTADLLGLREEGSDDDEADEIVAQPGGEVNFPDGLQDTSVHWNQQVQDGTLYVAFNSIQNRNTEYFVAGSDTVQVTGYGTTESTGILEFKVALWELSEDKATTSYVAGTTVYFPTGGECSTYTISGLTPGRLYKANVSYDSGMFYITGGVKIEGIGSDDHDLSAPITLYVLLLCAFHHVYDIGISGCSIRKLVGIYSRNHFIRPEYLLYTHVDDTFLLSESR